MQTVYVDILLLTNFLIDYFMLQLTALLSKCEKKRLRIFLAAAVAALTSLVIFLPEMSFVLETALHMVFSAVIVFFAFGFKNIKRFLKNIAVFFGANALLAGGSLVVWSVFGLKNLVVRNGAIFYNISPTVLVITTAAVYALSVLLAKIISRRQTYSDGVGITLYLFDKKIKLSGLMDSGNMLKDTFSSAPVIVCDYDRVKSLFDLQMQTIFSKENFEKGYYEDILKSKYCDRFRVIPFDSLGNSGLMTAFVLDSAVLHTQNGDKRIDEIIMAVTHKKISGGEFDAILNPSIAAVN